MKKMYDDVVDMIENGYTDDEIAVCISYLYDVNRADTKTYNWLKEQIKCAREMYEEDSQND